MTWNGSTSLRRLGWAAGRLMPATVTHPARVTAVGAVRQLAAELADFGGRVRAIEAVRVRLDAGSAELVDAPLSARPLGRQTAAGGFGRAGTVERPVRASAGVVGHGARRYRLDARAGRSVVVVVVVRWNS